MAVGVYQSDCVCEYAKRASAEGIVGAANKGGSVSVGADGRWRENFGGNMSIETRNAIITDATIQIDDHGFLTAYLMLDYGGSGQGFGGYILYLPKNYKHHRMNDGYAGHFIYRCMEIAGVNSWDKMAGKTIRVKQENSKVHEIGHIVKDNWFNPEKEFKEDN